MPDRLIDRQYLTVAEVAEQLGMNRNTIHRWIHRGLFRAIKIPGSGGWRIDAESLEQYLQSREVVKAGMRELKR